MKKFLFLPRGRLLRHPADRHGQGLHDRRRRGRRRRLAGLRQHALRAARRVLPRPVVVAHHDWKAELAPYYDQAKRMLGVVENPLRTPQRRGDAEGRRARWASATPSTRPRSACSSAAPGQAPGETVADPYFGGAGPDRDACIDCGECMTGCRHNAKNTLVKNYLYLAEQQRRRRAPADHGHPGPAAATAAATASTPAGPRRSCPGGAADQDVHRRARRLRGRLARHPAAAAPAQGRGRPAAALRPARPPHPHQLRVDPRRDRARPRRSTTARASRSPRRSTPTSTPTSSRSATARARNFMSLMQTVLTDGDGPRPRWQTWLQEMWEQRRERPQPLRLQALVGAHRHRAGHAVARQLDHDVPEEDAARLG